MTARGTGESYTYDTNGNMTTRVEGGLTYTQTFDTQNRLTSVLVGGQTTQFMYDPDGNLVKKIKPDGSKTLYVGGIYEVDKTSGGTVTGTKTYYPAAGAMRIGSTLYYVLKDHLGSASVVMDATGTIVVGEDRFYPFGETRFTTGTMLTDKLFTGQREITGLGIYYYGARFYPPKIGRFLSADTIVPSPSSPQAFNRYSYVLNNPIKLIDPSGHKCVGEPEECLDDDGTPINGAGGFGGGGGGGNGGGGNGGGFPPPIVIPDLPCAGMMTCGQQSPYDYVSSLLPFTSSDTCYFLLHDPILCNSSSWQNLPNISLTSAPTSGYCANISGLACVANLSQDVATLTDLVGVGLIEGPAVGVGCIEGGPFGCAIAEVGVAATWTLTLNNVETGASGASLLTTIADDVFNNGGWGENSSTSLATFAAGLVPLTPSWDLAVDTYASGYNHGFFNGVNTIQTGGLFK